MVFFMRVLVKSFDLILIIILPTEVKILNRVVGFLSVPHFISNNNLFLIINKFVHYYNLCYILYLICFITNKVI